MRRQVHVCQAQAKTEPYSTRNQSTAREYYLREIQTLIGDSQRALSTLQPEKGNRLMHWQERAIPISNSLLSERDKVLIDVTARSMTRDY